ncbi:MAG: hypothetical protein R2751_02900 [Bacteroidales bacterium]
MTNFLRIALAVLLLVVGLGAVPAGLAMILAPDGSKVGMTPDLLGDSLFGSFLIPGIVLFAVNGLANLGAATLLFRKHPKAWLAGLGLGLFLCGWIFVQAGVIGWVFILQPLFLGVGILEVILSVWLFRRNAYLEGNQTHPEP